MSRSPRQSAFTLIELLVVLAIVAILSSMLFGAGALLRDKAALRVEDGARGVERRLLEARNRAITSRVATAVIFHIENAGSGRVIRAGSTEDARGFPGRHWCAIVPMGHRFWGNALYSSPSENGSAQRYSAALERKQIGERYYLPRGARFLALGDVEDNLNDTSAARPLGTTAFVITDYSVGTKTRTGNSRLSDTYPRPYFGFLEEVAGLYTLHPWGGYDPAIYGSGLDYECTNRAGSVSPVAVFNSTNAQLCTCWVDPADSTRTPAVNQMLEELRPCCDDSQIGKPRPLINGYWQDFMIVFLPNGQSRTLTFYSRTTLFSQPQSNSVATDREFPKKIPNNSGGRPDTSSFRGRDDAIIHLELEAIGGTAITIARDPEEDTYTFQGPQLALNSLMPMRRIIVNESTGGVRVIKPFASIQQWLDDIEEHVPADQRVWGGGFEFCSPADPHPDKIRVTGAVGPEMLLQRNPYPWIKPKL